MRWLLLALMALVLGGPARAEGERAGDFDYYVMSLGWSPNWCALEGDARGDDQCDAAPRLYLHTARPLAAVRRRLAQLLPHHRPRPLAQPRPPR